MGFTFSVCVEGGGDYVEGREYSDCRLKVPWRTLNKQSPIFLAPGISYREDNFSTDWVKLRGLGNGWFQDDSSALR